MTTSVQGAACLNGPRNSRRQFSEVDSNKCTIELLRYEGITALDECGGKL